MNEPGKQYLIELNTESTQEFVNGDAKLRGRIVELGMIAWTQLMKMEVSIFAESKDSMATDAKLKQMIAESAMWKENYERVSRDIDAMRKEREDEKMIKVPQKLGEIGESEVMKFLEDELDEGVLNRTGSVAHQGDIQYTFEDNKVLIEVKNKGAITKNDVDKFVSDLETSGCDGAIFVSIRDNVKIPMKGFAHAQIIPVGEKEVIVFYITEFANTPMVLKSVMKLMCIMLKNKKYSRTENIQNTLEIVNKIMKEMSKDVENAKKHTESIKKSLLNVSNNLEKMYL